MSGLFKKLAGDMSGGIFLMRKIPGHISYQSDIQVIITIFTHGNILNLSYYIISYIPLFVKEKGKAAKYEKTWKNSAKTVFFIQKQKALSLRFFAIKTKG